MAKSRSFTPQPDAQSLCPYYTVSEAATLLNVSRSTLLRRIKTGEIHALRFTFNGRYRLLKKTVNDLLQPVSFPPHVATDTNIAQSRQICQGKNVNNSTNSASAKVTQRLNGG